MHRKFEVVGRPAERWHRWRRSYELGDLRAGTRPEVDELMNDQGMRLYNLNHARGGSSAFRILLNNCGNAYESTKSSETF
jgi:hypothetical protein